MIAVIWITMMLMIHGLNFDAMKNLRYIFVLALLAVSFSCARDNFESEDKSDTQRYVVREFDASISSDDADTKTALSSDGQRYRLSWISGDEITIKGSNTNTKAVVSNITNNGRKASFSASVAAGDQVYAIYPSSLYANIEGSSVEYSIPASQSGRQADATIIVAKDNQGSFNFKNASTVLKMSVNVSMYPQAAAVRVEPMDINQNLSGRARVSFDDYGYATVTPVGGGTPSITVQLTGSQLMGYKTVYATILPRAYNGMKMYILDGFGNTIRTVTCNKTLYARAGVVMNFDAITDHIDEYVLMPIEAFSGCVGEGGVNGNFGSAGASMNGTSYDDKTDINGWEFSNCFEANGCIRIGDNESKGYAITPKLGIESGRATVTYSAAKAGNGVNFRVFVVGQGYIDSHYQQSGNGKWEARTIHIGGANADTRLRFETDYSWTGTSSNNAFYLDNVKVIDGAKDFNYINIPDGLFYFVEAEDTLKDVILLYKESPTKLYSPSTPPFITGAYGMPYSSATTGVRVFMAENTSKGERSSSIKLNSSNLPTLSFTIIQRGKTKIALADTVMNFVGAGEEKELEYELWNFAEGTPLRIDNAGEVSPFVAQVASGKLIITVPENETVNVKERVLRLTATDVERTRECTLKLRQEHGRVAWPMSFSVDSLKIRKDVTYELPTLNVADTAVITYSISMKDSSIEVATIDPNTGALTLLGKDGEATVTATAAADEYHKETSVSYVLSVSGYKTAQPQSPSFSSSALTVYAKKLTINGRDSLILSSYTLPTLSGAQTVPEYSISDNPAASINSATGALTFTGLAGTATITASCPESEEWESATATYTLTVIEMSTKTLNFKKDTPNFVETTSVTANEIRFQTDLFDILVDRNGATSEWLMTAAGEYSSTGFRIQPGHLMTVTPRPGKFIMHIRLITSKDPQSIDGNNINVANVKEYLFTPEVRHLEFDIVDPTQPFVISPPQRTRFNTIEVIYYATE